MTVVGAIIEIVFLTIFLSIISGICMVAKVALDASIIALVMGGGIYALTVITRGDMHERDKNVHLN